MVAQPVQLERTVLDAAEAVITRHGLRGFTIERLAEEAETSRMTLHRRQITRQVVMDALERRAAESFFSAIWPALTSAASGAERMARALDAMCSVADKHLAFLAGLFADTGTPFHVTPAEHSTEAETDDAYVAPLARILRDGAADGSLEFEGDPEETAAVLFNLVGWGYVHLRYAQGWPTARARPSVVNFAIAAISTIRR